MVSPLSFKRTLNNERKDSNSFSLESREGSRERASGGSGRTQLVGGGVIEGGNTPLSPFSSRPSTEEEERAKIAIIKSPPISKENLLSRFRNRVFSPKFANNVTVNNNSNDNSHLIDTSVDRREVSVVGVVKSLPKRPVTPLSSQWSKNFKTSRKSSNFSNLLNNI